ncbi:MAG: class I SAM-dependent methyltransferase [Cyclobacteriaceae bacterium]|nr:class I SAM-dependent methyltransferase [Cyclobacteriaceae bacterium]
MAQLPRLIKSLVSVSIKSQGKNPKNKIGIATTIVQCKQCGLIFSNPQPIPENISDHYGVPPEEYWKADYFKIDGHYFKTEINTLKSLYNFKEGDKALDIGAGLGKCMIALQRAGYDVYGFEPSKPFYERAISKMGIASDKLQNTMIEDANYPNNFFDFITFGAVLEHLYDPSSSIKKAFKWLKPGGIIQIEVPSSDWLIAKILNTCYKVRGLDYVSNLSPMHEPFHLFEFSLKSFQLHSVVNQYEIVFHEYYVAQTFMPKVLDFVLVPIMRLTNKGMQLCVWLQKKE